MCQDLLRQIAIVLGRVALRIVLEHGAPFHGRLGELDRLADPRLEDELAEVLLEDLDRLLGVDGPGIEHGRQDALDLDLRVEVLPDHLEGVLELDEPPHRQVLALDRDDHLVGRGQRVDRQQAEARRRVDADVVVVVGDLRQRLLQRPLAADLGAHRDLGAGQVDRGDGDVDLAVLDDLLDRHPLDEHVVEALLDGVGVDPLAHRQVALRIEVDGEDAVTGLREGDGQVQGRRRLRDAALLVREGEHLHRSLRSRLLRRGGEGMGSLQGRSDQLVGGDAALVLVLGVGALDGAAQLLLVELARGIGGGGRGLGGGGRLGLELAQLVPVGIGGG